MIETDITRELGHERDDVDNYYKDKYLKKWDLALLKLLVLLSV
jgi:hypothetical protein